MHFDNGSVKSIDDSVICTVLNGVICRADGTKLDLNDSDSLSGCSKVSVGSPDFLKTSLIGRLPEPPSMVETFAEAFSLFITGKVSLIAFKEQDLSAGELALVESLRLGPHLKDRGEYMIIDTGTLEL